MARSQGCGGPVAPALCRSNGERGIDEGGTHARQSRFGVASSIRGPRFRGSRDAGAPCSSDRGNSQAVRDTPQRARHRSFSAHCHRTVPQTPRHRRYRASLRDRPHLPQRRRRLHAQSRVHDARGLPSVRRLRGCHDSDGERGGWRGGGISRFCDADLPRPSP